MTTVHFQTVNGQWVAVDFGQENNPLVANRSGIGSWGAFEMTESNNGALVDGASVNLKAANGLYVCAEKGGGGELVANMSTLGLWETFTLKRAAGNGSLVTGDQIALQAANGQFVCAERGGGQILVANRSALGPWEKFGIKFPVT